MNSWLVGLSSILLLGACGEFVDRTAKDAGSSDSQAPEIDAAAIIPDAMPPDPLALAIGFMSGNQGRSDESPLPGVPTANSWSHGSFIVQGGQPDGASVPSYHPAFADSAEGQLLAGPWNGLQVFAYVVNGSNHGSGLNAAVEVDQYSIEIFSKTDEAWTNASTGTLGIKFHDRTLGSLATGYGSFASVADGTTLVGFDQNLNPAQGMGLLAIGGGPIHALAGDDVCGVRVSLRARLALRNPTGIDERDQADYLLQLGLNYYPSVDSSNADLGGYPPTAGASRAVRVENDWKTFHFISLQSALDVDTSGRLPSTCHVMSESEFFASNPS